LSFLSRDLTPHDGTELLRPRLSQDQRALRLEAFTATTAMLAGAGAVAAVAAPADNAADQANANNLNLSALAALDAELGTALGGFGVVTTNLTVSSSNVAAAVAGRTSGPLSDPAFPGVMIDLTTAVINTITANILGLVTSLTDNVEAALRVTVLPAADALELTLGTGRVGPNILNVVPVATALVPSSGSKTGGTPVTVTGSCFTGAAVVLIGGVPAMNVVVINDTTITADAPAGVGVADVTVVGGGTCGTGTLPGGFTFLPAAVVCALTPDNGPEAGGTAVTITGTGFTGATIAVTTPAHAPAIMPVVVSGPGGTSVPLIFTFTAVTMVDTVDPGVGSETGGATVTITGSCFTGATDVLFGGVSATSFTVASDAQITAVTPAGTVVVRVDAQGEPDQLGYTYEQDGAVPVQGGSNRIPFDSGSGGTPYGDGFLASTGVNWMPITLFGILALLLGGALVPLRKRGHLRRP
jgi:hypothetical protein